MLKKLFAVLLFLLIVVGISLAIYFTFRNTGSQGKDIELNTKYYLRELRNGMYEYPRDPAVVYPDRNFIRPTPQNHSYGIFDDDFKTFRIYFLDTKLDTKARFDFIISQHKQRKGRLTATLHHIYKGEIHTYKLTTTQDKIMLTSTVKYLVMIASDEYIETTPKWITRKDTIFMSFNRTRPSYIQEGH
jgi:hypothetical protein